MILLRSSQTIGGPTAMVTASRPSLPRSVNLTNGRKEATMTFRSRGHSLRNSVINQCLSLARWRLKWARLGDRKSQSGHS